MSEKLNLPLIYSAEQQANLARLDNTNRILRNIAGLLSEGQFFGKHCLAVKESNEFIANLLEQVSGQVKEINETASQMAKESVSAPEQKAS